MTAKRRTGLAVLLVSVGLIAWEAVSIALPAYAAKISVVVWDTSDVLHLLPLLAGILCGHFFGLRELETRWALAFYALVALAVLVLLANAQLTPAAFMAGYPMGTVFWPRPGPLEPTRFTRKGWTQ